MNTMVHSNRLLTLLAAILLTSLVSCQREPFEERADDIGMESYNQLSMSSYNYDVEMALTRAGEVSSQVIEEDGHSFTFTATPRGLETRSSYVDTEWGENDSKVGIYVVEHVDDSDLDSRTVSNLKVVEASANLGRKGNTILSSSVELLEHIRHYDSSNAYFNKKVDICAYFPYAEEITDFVALSNSSNSIVGIFDKSNANNVLHLPFSMKPVQTDKNIWFHDMLISVREDAVLGKNAYGNIGKMNRSTYDGTGNIDKYYDLEETLRNDRPGKITCDNVHLRMRHIFSQFNIYIKYDSRFEGATIDRLYVDGTKVYSYGEVNLLKGEVTPSGTSVIDRLISDNVIHGDVNTMMMLCPCKIEAEGDMVFHIIIDNVEYKCDLYKIMKDVEIKDSYIYDLTLSFSTNSTLVVNNGYGGAAATVQYNPGEFDTYGTYGERLNIASSTSVKPYEEIGAMAQWLVAAPKTGWTFKGIYVNGEQIPYNSGSSTLTSPLEGYRSRPFTTAEGTTSTHYYCKLSELNDKNTRYDVVYVPETTNWYKQPEHIIQQFDGIYNNGFSSVIKTDAFGEEYDAAPPTDPSVTLWKDLSGRGNDAQLGNIEIHPTLQPWREALYDQTSKGSSGISYTQYNTTMQSGWVAGGLKFDGVNDYVTFPAVLPSRDSDPDSQDMNLTIEMYLCIESPQAGYFPRILCEAEPGIMWGSATFTTHGYPSLVFGCHAGATPTSTNVQFYHPSNDTKTLVEFMGYGHNNGFIGTLSDIHYLWFKPDGNRILHLVFWYRGGYGTLTDMSIFDETNQKASITGELGGGDPRNCLVTMYEFWNPSTNSMERKAMSFHGDDNVPSKDGEAAYKLLLEHIFNQGNETTPAEYETLKTNNINLTRILNCALEKDNIVAQDTNNAYLEDPFIPSERWACIGGRQNDYSRQLNATVFSYIMYDTLLTIEEVEYNRQLHFDRFGAYKTDLR